MDDTQKRLDDCLTEWLEHSDDDDTRALRHCAKTKIQSLQARVEDLEGLKAVVETLLREAEECGATFSCMDVPQYSPSYIIEICKGALGEDRRKEQ